MKNISEYINETKEKFITFRGNVLSDIPACDYKLDVAVKTYAKTQGKDCHNIEYGASFDSIVDAGLKGNLYDQGCKWVIAYPPHKSNGNDVDYYSIYMFTSSKKYHDMYMGSERLAVINTKTSEIENENNLQKEGQGWKITRLN